MPLKRITFSGIDETVDPRWMTEFAVEYFKETGMDIEWGILLSHKNERPRYPGKSWIKHLLRVAAEKELNLAGHLCGKYARAFIENDLSQIDIELESFDRLQINFAPYIESVDKEKVFQSAYSLKSCYILQAGTNLTKTEEIATYFSKRYINTNVLFDCSGGQGLESKIWPKKIDGILCGYAGGISPSNIYDKVVDICGTNNHGFWIDMESGIRTKDVTDIDKIIEVANIARRL